MNALPPLLPPPYIYPLSYPHLDTIISSNIYPPPLIATPLNLQFHIYPSSFLPLPPSLPPSLPSSLSPPSSGGAAVSDATEAATRHCGALILELRMIHTIPYHTIAQYAIPYHTIPHHAIPYHTRHNNF